MDELKTKTNIFAIKKTLYIRSVYIQRSLSCCHQSKYADSAHTHTVRRISTKCIYQIHRNAKMSTRQHHCDDRLSNGETLGRRYDNHFLTNGCARGNEKRHNIIRSFGYLCAHMMHVYLGIYNHCAKTKCTITCEYNTHTEMGTQRDQSNKPRLTSYSVLFCKINAVVERRACLASICFSIYLRNIIPHVEQQPSCVGKKGVCVCRYVPGGV